MSYVGIDLGTSRVRAAVMVGATAQVVQFGDGSHFLPAVVAVDKGTLHLGRAALARAAMNPQDAVLGVKRILGRAASDDWAMRIARRSGAPVSSQPDGGIALHLGGGTYTPEDVVAALLSHVANTVAAASSIPRPT